jgi:F-type H+-transporting ATPase subunit epsilon
MIPKSLVLDIVTPDRPMVRTNVDEVQLPGMTGALGILPGHAPMLAGLQPGELWFRNGAEKQFLSISFGVAEVLPDRVTVLATVAERPDEIDVAEVEASRKTAEQQMRQPGSLEDAERARLALMAAIVRLRVADRSRRHRG